MTIGIYKLSFIGTDKVYIGQSIHCETRYRQHCNTLKKTLGSDKLQQAYILFGIPNMHIMEECSTTELNTIEQKYIVKFNSIINGFNTADVTQSRSQCCGELHGMAKYSNNQIIESLNLLIHRPCIPLNNISSITGVNVRILEHILNGSSHGTWLKEVAYEEYSTLEKQRSMSRHAAINIGKIYPVLYSPEGAAYKVENIVQFAKANNLDPGNLSRVLNGKVKQHKKWHI